MGLLDDLRNASEEEVDTGGADYAQAWRWDKEGDEVEGIVVSISSRVHENHPDGYPILVLRKPDGTDVAIHGMTYVLKDEITKRNLRPGDQFAAIYVGKRPSPKTGRTFHAFKVASRQGDGTVPANLTVAAAASEPPF